MLSLPPRAILIRAHDVGSQGRETGFSWCWSWNLFLLLWNETQKLGGIPGDNRICQHILRHDAARTDDSVFADRDIAENGRTRSYRSAFFHKRLLNLPVRFGLQRSAGGCARIRIVDKCHAMADKDVVFDVYAFANKSVARDLAP